MRVYIGEKSSVKIFRQLNLSNDLLTSSRDDYLVELELWQQMSAYRLTTENRIELNLARLHNSLPIRQADFVDYPWYYMPTGRRPPDLNCLVYRLMRRKNDIVLSRDISNIYPDPLEKRTCAAFTTRFLSGHYIEFLRVCEIGQRLQRLDHFVGTWLNRPPDIVAAICAMAEFLIIHPFIDGNGRAARLLFHLMMADRDHGRRIVPPLAPAIAHNRFAFISAMLACELDADIRPLCDFVCAALAATKAIIESSESAIEGRSSL